MRTIRRLKGFPQPYSDETLTSWLFRCTTSKRCVLTIDAVEDYVLSALRNGIDYDFGFGGAFKRLCVRSGIDYLFCRKYFGIQDKNVILDARMRNAFCRQCLDEDVIHRSTPYWRRTWCRVDVAYCAAHKTLLATTGQDYGLYRSWESFGFFPGCDYERRYEEHIFEFATLNILGFRVQNWLYTNRKEIERTVGASKLIGDLLGSFLSLRTEYRYCGIARVAFGCARQVPIVYKNYHYSLCMYHGARNSNSTHRKAALIVLGVVLGLYDDRELEKLKRAAIYNGSLFPSSAAEAGACVLELLTEPERGWYVLRFPSMPPVAGLDTNLRMEEFLSRIRKSRVRPLKCAAR